MSCILAGNWKMNMTKAEAVNYCREFKNLLRADMRYMLAVPATLIETVAKELSDTKVVVAAQNVSHAVSGAFTGDLSVTQLTDAGATAFLVGHSERRHVFLETNERIKEKMERICELGTADLKPGIVLCVGETLEQREKGETESVLSRQLQTALKGMDNRAELIVAYEPVWAIGTGVNASAEQAESAVKYIKSKLAEIDPVYSGVRVLYGGSVTPENTEELFKGGVLDGALVGGASLLPVKFMSIGAKMKCGNKG
ncbi:MAG: triose-phosphate isomerase [Firmicutes bacterium]|nr:triose-phosphate isomerase [Bacillota bacterium]